jgi:RNA polymerase sigma-70 factor (ECF subfamily)
MPCLARTPDADARTCHVDAEARMREVLAAHWPTLNRFVLSLSQGNWSRAEDLLQEVTLRVWRHLDDLPLEADATRRWLYTVARRLVIDDIRKRQKRPTEVGPLDNENDRASGGDLTSSIALANHTLLEAVRTLSPAHREVLNEVFFMDRSVDEAAARLGIPVGTVRSRIHYAIRSLREALVD